jgi:mono/diheme cytochrome c family protein
MRPKENYTRHVAVAFVLTLAILASFQIYLLREPVRIASVEASDKAIAVNAGQALFKTDCTLCHGSNGEGDVGPALNDKTFLNTTSDDTIFSVISSGVPGTQMPAWNQAHGGPLTDQDITQVVAYIRAWQPTATDIRSAPPRGDSGRGRTIFNSVCVTCHGDNGVGTDKVPALNDAQKLNQFDDAWYRDTIAQGRPAKGMPTWGTVLSPQQISDLIALVDVWRQNPAPSAAITPTPTVEVARPSNPGGPGPALGLVGNVESGAKIFVDNCQKCHGPQGTGGVENPGSDDGTIPPLNPIDETMVNADPKVFAYNIDLFVEHGSTPSGPNPKQVMPAWGDDKKLTAQQMADVIAYVMSLNPAPSAEATPTPEPTPTVEVARPSNPGGPGPALTLVGNIISGTQVFVDNCQKCHGPQGAGGVDNPGSDDGTIPPLNPIDETMVSADPKVFAYNIDLFVEHGSTPSGTNPKQVMPAWGDDKKLTAQQIADVIAYIISLNGK